MATAWQHPLNSRLIGKKQFLQRCPSNSQQALPLVHGHGYSNLSTSLGHHLGPLRQARFKELAEPGCRVLKWPCLHTTPHAGQLPGHIAISPHSFVFLPAGGLPKSASLGAKGTQGSDGPRDPGRFSVISYSRHYADPLLAPLRRSRRDSRIAVTKAIQYGGR
jgi:hypothetical protein